VSGAAWRAPAPVPPDGGSAPADGTPATAGLDGGSGERRGDDRRLGDLERDLRGRLGAVCRGWPAPEFEAIVRRLADMKLRWFDEEPLH
jgi:hypothetical protein